MKTFVNKPLNPFEKWMVKQNLEYAKLEGLETVVSRLLANGYERVASAVAKEARILDQKEGL